MAVDPICGIRIACAIPYIFLHGRVTRHGP